MSVVEYPTRDGIAYVKLDRPEKNNSLNRAVFERLCQPLRAGLASQLSPARFGTRTGSPRPGGSAS